jgi:hypothetical protein
VPSNFETSLERRAFQRFDVECSVRYRVIAVEVSGSGKTVNISRSGVLLAIDRSLCAGLRVEIEMDWPAKAPVDVSFKLVIKGRIVRSMKNGIALVAIKISWYGFRAEVPQPDKSALPRKFAHDISCIPCRTVFNLTVGIRHSRRSTRWRCAAFDLPFSPIDTSFRPVRP